MTFAHSFYNMDNVLHIYDSEYVYNVETNVALDSSDLQVDAIWINQWNKRNKKIIRDYSRWFSWAQNGYREGGKCQTVTIH